MNSGTYKLVGCDNDVERSVFVVSNRFPIPELSQHSSIFCRTPIRERFDVGNEFGDLLLPIVKGRSGRDDEERSPDVVNFGEVSDERYRLNSLSETHL